MIVGIMVGLFPWLEETTECFLPLIFSSSPPPFSLSISPSTIVRATRNWSWWWLDAGLQASLQNYENIHFCCLSHPHWDIFYGSLRRLRWHLWSRPVALSQRQFGNIWSIFDYHSLEMQLESIGEEPWMLLSTLCIRHGRSGTHNKELSGPKCSTVEKLWTWLLVRYHWVTQYNVCCVSPSAVHLLSEE